MYRFQYRHGFTLIELMIVIAVIGIIAAIAYPSYIDSMRKAKRSDATTALLELQMDQEKFRASNTSYAASTTALGWTSATTEGGYYTLKVTANSSTGFTATATAVTGKGQDKDTGCTTISVNQDGKTGVTSCWD